MHAGVCIGPYVTLPRGLFLAHAAIWQRFISARCVLLDCRLPTRDQKLRSNNALNAPVYILDKQITIV